MSSVTILCPNGKRTVVKITPNTSVLQILEDACTKQDFDPSCYGLKLLARKLDVNTTVRFGNIPNRSALEMFELPVPRKAAPVTVCVVDHMGAKHIKDHLPTDSVYTVLSHCIAVSTLEDQSTVPVIVYSMQRVAGVQLLKDSTLKSLGMGSGRVSIRFSLETSNSTLRKATAAEESMEISSSSDVKKSEGDITEERLSVSVEPDKNVQHNVINSAEPDILKNDNVETSSDQQPHQIPSSESISSVNLVESKKTVELPPNVPMEPLVSDLETNNPNIPCVIKEGNTVSDKEGPSPDVVSSNAEGPDLITECKKSKLQPDVLPGSEEKSPVQATESKPAPKTIAFSGSGYSLGAAKTSDVEAMEVDQDEGGVIQTLSEYHCVVFRGSEMSETATHHEELDENFFRITVADMKSMFADRVKESRSSGEAPLMTKGLQEAQTEARTLAVVAKFPVIDLRISFPQDIIVQAKFRPTDLVAKVQEFVSRLLSSRDTKFSLLNHYPRAPLPPSQTLLEAGLVPKARLHVSGGAAHPAVVGRVGGFEEALKAVANARPVAATGLGDPDPVPQKQTPAPSPSSTSTERKVESTSKKPKWFKMGK